MEFPQVFVAVLAISWLHFFNLP